MRDLSIIIPARNEMFLQETIDDVFKNAKGNIEVIAVLDGYWPEVGIKDDPRLTLIHHSESVGQRAACNEAAGVSQAKYLMKIDAHCGFDQGFDIKMMELMQPDYTMVPVMRNLHAFDWVCPDGHRRYQGPSGVCKECGKETKMEMVWVGKTNPQSTAYRFDTDMHFQYWNDWGRKQKGDLTETMSIQGSCFMVTRDKYFELDLCSEKDFGSWGQQGVEVACKTWLSGGRVVVNRKTWYGHMFRTSPGDFGFPYPNPNRKVVENREKSKELFARDKWPLAKHKFQWLINKFNPPGWTVNPKKGIVFYTDNRLRLHIAYRVQKQLKKISKEMDIPIVSVSLKPMPHFGVRNVWMGQEHTLLTMVDKNLKETPYKPEPGLLMMSKQILAGLKVIDADIVFLCEHDVLYHPSHFDFTPLKKDVYYYNTNAWWLRAKDGHCLYFDHRAQSGLCGFKETLIKYYTERIRRIEELIASEKDGMVVATSGNLIPLKEGIHRLGFEPGTHNRPEKVDDLPAEDYRSEVPIIDIRHDSNLTQNRWSIKQFRSKPKEWIETDEIPGWGKGREIV